jgi:hypothetical protein
MARPSWRTLKSGDLLSIPVDKNLIAIGHVVDEGQELYLCVYQPLFSSDERELNISGLQVALVARTSDELVWHGRWMVIGHQDPPTNIPRPFYVIDTPDGLRLKDFHGTDVRQATESDLAFYGRNFSVSNIKFAKIMRHIHGIEPYPSDFTRITYDFASARTAAAME